MAIKNLDFWYDSCMRRYLEQLVRAFSGFQYQTGYNSNGPPQLLMVPCTLANTNKQVGNILRNNSENTLLAAPRITIWQTGLTGRRSDVQYPGFVDTLQVVERQYDPVTKKLTKNRGNGYTVQRLMPRPFDMAIQVDIWTTNLDQKHQLLEQILTVIYPSFDIQNSENPLDWTALTAVYVEDDITLSSRSIPVGADSEIDIASFRLRVPILLSPPAKVKAQRIIKQIVANVFDSDKSDQDGFGGTTGTLMTREIVTPGDYRIRVDGASITLLGGRNAKAQPDGTPYVWMDLLNLHGVFKPTISSIRLYYTDDFENGPFVIGTLQLDATAPNKLIWQIDPNTIPANTLLPFNALIDPLRTFPGVGLPAPVAGTRYMIVNDIGPSQAWGSLTAYANDIIQYNAGVWAISFSARSVTSTQLVLNLHTGSQLRWTGTDWVMSIDGEYSPGFWRLKL